MKWANSSNTRYFLKETTPPAGYEINPTVIPVVVGTYGIYADAGTEDDGVSVAADVGRLTQSMRQYAMGNDVDITLQDLTAIMQVQPSLKEKDFSLNGWKDAALEGTDTPRNMNLHFGLNAFKDYGLHDEDGGKHFNPFFVTKTGFVRTRVQQERITERDYKGSDSNVRKDNLGKIDLTNLFSLLNMVVVTDQNTDPKKTETGELTISKWVINGSDGDYTKNFTFTITCLSN